MKRGRPNNKSSLNLAGLTKKNDTFQSYYKSKSHGLLDQNEMIINIDKINSLIQQYNKTENVTINNSNEAFKLLNNSLREYLKNIIQNLIENNRRRTYTKYISFPKQKEIISYGINVQRAEDEIINSKKNKLYPKKNLNLIKIFNMEKKIDLLNKYDNLLKNKKSETQNEIENKEVVANEDKKEDDLSDDDLDFFGKNNKNNQNTNKDILKEHQGIMNVYQSAEITLNKKLTNKGPIKRNIELKDLVNYLEDNSTIPLSKELLYKAYTQLTLNNK